MPDFKKFGWYWANEIFNNFGRMDNFIQVTLKSKNTPIVNCAVRITYAYWHYLKKIWTKEQSEADIKQALKQIHLI